MGGPVDRDKFSHNSPGAVGAWGSIPDIATQPKSAVFRDTQTKVNTAGSGGG